jgi:tRNA(Arg) A34 adenosine deaminase TadA
MTYEEDVKHMRDAYIYAKGNSHNPKTQTGAKLVLPNGISFFGANMFAEGIPYDETKIHPPEVYDWLPHAEKTAISRANNKGLNHLLREGVLYTYWDPCSGCSQDITLYNLNEVILHKELNEFNAKIQDRPWGQDAALEMLEIKGIKYRYIEGKLFKPEEDFYINFRGHKFSP